MRHLMIRNMFAALFALSFVAAPAMANEPVENVENEVVVEATEATEATEVVETTPAPTEANADVTLTSDEAPEATPEVVVVEAKVSGPSGSVVLGGLWGALLVGFVIPAVLLLVDAFAKSYLPQPKWLVAGGSGALGGVIVGLSTGGGFFGAALGFGGAVASWFVCDQIIKRFGSDA